MSKASLLFAVGLAFTFGIAPSLGCGSKSDGDDASTSLTMPNVPPERCEAGMGPSLESGTCVPVGPLACADGFEPSASGWGCSAILPAAACTGATRAVLGQTKCVPVDDCDRAFPPANAVLVHDDASLQSALAAARSGATIALDSGTYGAIEVPAAVSALHVVGRCADKVTIEGTGARGVFATGAMKVSVESVTVEGFQGGVVASWGAEISATHIVVRDTQLPLTAGGDAAKLAVTDSVVELTKAKPSGGPAAAALSAQQTGALTAQGLDVRGYDAFASGFEAGTTIAARRSVFTYDGAIANTDKISALANGDILFEESALRFRKGRFAFVARDLPGVPATAKSAGGSLHFKDSTITQSGVELDGAMSTVHDGGKVSLEGTTLEHQSFSAWMVGDAASAITTKDSVIRGIAKTDAMRNAIWLLDGATADLDDTAIVDAQQTALVVGHGGSQMTMKKSLVYETSAGRTVTDPDFGSAGIGVLAADSATLSINDSAIVYSRYAGVMAAADAQINVQHSVIDASRTGPEGTGGCGLAAVSARVVMEDSLVRGSQDVALVFLSGEGIVKHTHFIDNPVGVHISETTLIDAKEDPQSSTNGQLIFFQNVFEGTQTPVRDAPYEPPPEPEPTPLGK